MQPKELPEKGKSKEELFKEMEDRKEEDIPWLQGRSFSLIYHGGSEVKEIGREAYAHYIAENGLGPLAFPSLKNFENEIIGMALGLLGGNDKSAGSLTSGGTESILMSVKTVRDYYRDKKPSITQPNMVIPHTAHPGWVKAAHYLGLEVIFYNVDSGYAADMDKLKSSLNENTILMVGSAPTYPHGVIDPIEEMGKIALEKEIWLHVDACLGGFILPFVRMNGHDIPPFDLSVPGVKSISADVHKYGFSPKGTSSILYKEEALRKYQFYAFADWPGGVYVTSALAGARPGGAIASAWAVMNYLGLEGYKKLAKDAMTAAQKLKDAIAAMENLHILGNPLATIMGIASDTVNIYELAEQMKNKNWYIEGQQLPPSIHITISPYHINTIDEFIGDLDEVSRKVEKLGDKDISQSAALYGMLGSLPDRKAAKNLALNFLNDIYK